MSCALAVPRAAPRARRLTGVLLLAAALSLLAGLAPAGAQDTNSDGPLIDVVEVEGVIDQTIADYISERVAQAADDGAQVLVLRIDTPGGLGVSMDAIVETITTSDVPVAVWVGPPGAQAASAGVYIGYAAHLLAVAPGTIMGAATPVDLGGGDLPEKAITAAEARLVGLAELRGRDLDFARAAVRDAAVVVASPGGGASLPSDAPLPEGADRDAVQVLDEARLVDRGIVDFMAPSLPDVLRELDGREVMIAGPAGEASRVLDVNTETANLRFHNLGIVRRVLHTVANPTLAYLLLIAGALCIFFEVFQPGFGVAGVTGLAMSALGLYGLSVLPVSWLAFGLIVLGLVLLAADLAVSGLGALTAGGTLGLAVGSFLLFTGPDLLRVSPWVIALVVIFNVVFFVAVMTTVLRAQGNQALSGAESLVGRTAIVRSMLNPEGHVFVEGALWRARAPESAGKVKSGTVVRVIGLDDRLTLEVEPIDEHSEEQQKV